MFCNIVYAYLVAGASAEQREELDGALYAPAGGGNATDQFLRRVMEDDTG